MSGSIPPKSLDEYRLKRFLGEGAMGQVYLYRDTQLDRDVAIKFISRPSDLSRKRFSREAKAIARLQHINIVAIYRSGNYEQWPYIVQEFVSGETLSTYQMPMAWQRAGELGVALASGLAAAHHAGVLHRDIKPGNIMLARSGHPKLVDFGLAKLVESRGPRSHAADSNEPPDATPVDDETVTRKGQILGTSHYLAPEIWSGQPASPRTDVYSLGVVLFQMCTGHVPFRDALEGDLPHVLAQRAPPPVASVAPDIPEAFARIIDRCIRRAPDRRYPSGMQLRDALEVFHDANMREPNPEVSPYRGLLAFEANDRGLFFGRGQETSEVSKRLHSDKAVLVVGDSGIGKSSLVRAGVIPYIDARGLSDDRAWSTCVFMPGKAPMQQLAGALANRLDLDTKTLMDELTQDQTNFVTRVTERLQRRHGRISGTVFCVDQMEELVTICAPADAGRFVQVLCDILQSVPSSRLLATTRGDYLTRVAALPGMRLFSERSLYFLHAPSAAGVREAIVEPARVAGFDFESSAMVDTLVESTLSASAGLPLLQFALLQLWGLRDVERGIIPERALTDIGGVTGALAKHADRVWSGLLGENRAAARVIVLRLVSVHGTRSAVTESVLIGDHEARRFALEGLCRGRLVVARESEGEPVYALAHEALVGTWPKLKQWLDGGLREIMERLASAASDWERLQRDRGALWRGKKLQEAERIVLDELTEPDRSFLQRSQRAALRGRRLRRGLVLVVLVLAIAAYTTIRYLQARDLERKQEREAREIAVLVERAAQDEQVGLDEAQNMATAQERALGHFRAGRTDSGNTARSESLYAGQAAAGAFADSSRSLESALRIDTERDDVRSALLGVLDRRVRLAHERGQYSARDALLEQLRFQDREGSMIAPWLASRDIILRTSEPGLRVALCQYLGQRDGSMSCAPVGDSQLTPTTFQLTPGSYRFTVQANEPTGSAVVHYPFRVAHLPGQTPALAVLHVPRAADIPDGYAYIPPGEYQYGFGRTTEDEGVRQWYETMPLHTRSMNTPYLISHTEVTYSEWLRYLDALPPEERATALPRAGDGKGEASVALLDLGDGRYTLDLQVIESRSTSRLGVPVVYPGRTMRREQNWARLPVTAISAQQARAYAAWLDHSGQVPGARLCFEDEWERAARGADARLFPHGDRLQRTDANFDETHGKRPDAYGLDEVGAYPASASPFGLLDMVGNAHEMTVSRIDPTMIVRRSGSFFHGRPTNVLTNRDPIQPSQTFARTGFRVCASMPVP